MNKRELTAEVRQLKSNRGAEERRHNRTQERLTTANKALNTAGSNLTDLSAALQELARRHGIEEAYIKPAVRLEDDLESPYWAGGYVTPTQYEKKSVAYSAFDASQLIADLALTTDVAAASARLTPKKKGTQK